MMLGPLQTKWVEALESGRFEQGTGWLRCGDRYCCLGVLLEHVLGVEPKYSLPSGEYCYGVSFASLGYAQRERIGLSEPSTHLLMEMNDGQGLSFSEIARAIKAEPGKFFMETK